MSLQIRPGYIDPLTTMTRPKQDFTFFEKTCPSDRASDLWTRQQQLQNTLLLMRSTGTDSGVSTAEQQEKLQAELEKVSEALRAARRDVPRAEALSAAKKTQADSTTFSVTRPRMDTYETHAKEQPSPGIYQVRREKGSDYRISFVPYFE